MKEYWIKAGGKVRGPFNATQLKKLAASGKLRRDHKVSSDQETWTLAEEVSGLRFPETTAPNDVVHSANIDRATAKTASNPQVRAKAGPSPRRPTKEIYLGSSFSPFYKWGLILTPMSASGMSFLALHFLYFKYFLFVGSTDGGAGQAEQVYFTSLITIYSASSAGHFLFALSGFTFALMGGSGFAYVLLQTTQRLCRGKPLRERYFILLSQNAGPRVRVEQIGLLAKYSTFRAHPVSRGCDYPTRVLCVVCSARIRSLKSSRSR